MLKAKWQERNPLHRRRGLGTLSLVLILGTAAGCGDSGSEPDDSEQPTPMVNAVIVTKPNLNRLAIVDLESNEQIDSVDVGHGPGTLVFTPDGSTAYVVNRSGWTISIVEASTSSVVDSLEFSVPPFDAAVTPDGSKLYVALGGNGEFGSVAAFETSGHSLTATIELPRTDPSQSDASGMAVTPDGAFVYVIHGRIAYSTVEVISTETDSVITTIEGPGHGGGADAVVADPNGDYVYIANPHGDENVAVISTATREVVDTIEVTGRVDALDISPDATFLYVVSRGLDEGLGTLSVIDLDTRTEVATVPDIGNGPGEIALTGDGSLAYIANFNSGDVTVIETATNTILTRITGLSNVEGVAVTPM